MANNVTAGKKSRILSRSSSFIIPFPYICNTTHIKQIPFFFFLTHHKPYHYINMADQVPEVPLVLVSNPYLEKKASIIRQKPILWEVT